MSKRNENLTELVFILDRSGSMGGLESDTIGGFNSVLKQNKELDGECFVSTVLFDHETKVLHDRIPINEVAPMNEKDYQVRGCTALLDALGGAIHHIAHVQKYMPDGHKAGHVIFTIITDGFENSSKEYTYGKVKKLIDKYEKKGWEFVFLGANIDAAAEAGRLGIAADRATNYVADKTGCAMAYDAVAAATCEMRSVPCATRVNGSWMDDVKADYASRG